MHDTGGPLEPTATTAATRRRSMWQTLAIVTTALVLTGCGELTAGLAGDSGELPQNALDPAGPIAQSQDALWNLVFPIAIFVFVLVQGMIIYCAIRFRARGDDAPPKQVAGNTKLEIFWTAVPALVLAVIAVPTVQGIFELADDPGDDALQVRVVGKQYWWEFEYLDDEGQGVVTANELHIPTDRTVRLTMESRAANLPDTEETSNVGAPAADGVIHSFWVPRLAGKQDVVAGHERLMTIEADEPGRYPGQCAEFCGLSHSRMRFVVEAHEEADFEDWLAEQAEPADDDLNGQAAEGQTLVDELGCLACHAIDGHPADAGVRIGPDLTKFATREVFAGAIFDNDDDEQLRAWIRNAPQEKDGAQMPSFADQVDDEGLDALVEYLRTLD